MEPYSLGWFGRFLQAKLGLYLDKYEKGLEAAKLALRLNPHHPEIYKISGQILMCLEKYEEAGYYFKLHLELNPQSAFSYAELGESYRLRGKYDESLVYLKRALELDRDYVWPLDKLVDLCLQEGKEEEGRQIIGEIIEKQGETGPEKSAAALLGLAEVYRSTDRRDEAVQLLKEGVKEYPNFPACAETLFDLLMELERLLEMRAYLEMLPREELWVGKM